MAKKLFVGNLPHSLQESEFKELFAQHGEVVSARIITDRETGRPRGFGFIEMNTSEEAAAAIGELNGKEVNGRAIAVNEARERESNNRGPRR
ncbi:MAG: RNA-binding protein [Simkaniaceae bacterium]|nr:RNA-binding protein [Simkaniaceae bacterium]